MVRELIFKILSFVFILSYFIFPSVISAVSPLVSSFLEVLLVLFSYKQLRG